MTNGKTGTSDIHDYNHQQQGRHQWQQQQQHNPVATIDTGYYADIVQQPVRVRCSEHYNNGIVTHPIEPCIAVQFHRKIQPDILGSRPLEVKVQQQVTPRHPLSKSEAMSNNTHYAAITASQQQQASSSSSSLVEQHIPHTNTLCLCLPNTNTLQVSFNDCRTPKLSGITHLSPCHHPHSLSHEAPNSTNPADADHCPDSKRSVWTDITHHVLQSPLHQSRQHPCLEAKLLLRTLSQGKMGIVVCSSSFPDIGIKVSGQFKLRIVISRMPQENCPHSLMNDQTHCTICKHSTQLAEVTTDIFTSYPADTWEGHCSQTPLSNHFSRQGIHIPTFKPNNKNRPKLHKKTKLSE
ncbi:hypothetical protein BASA62_006469 [Batrachochytrium salamandrivorans]|nr:hypothetical protein BASA62_006469 [Batrachochytrium salamandrivorans]